MSNPRCHSRPFPRPELGSPVARLALAVLLTLAGHGALQAHVVPPEQLHPVAASFRRVEFFLNLNPIPWQAVNRDLAVISAVGTRAYYRGLGFADGSLYQHRPLRP